MGVNRRTLLTRQCPRCGREMVDPYTLFRLPGELEDLAQALNLPAESVKAIIDTGKIPIRRAVDKNGRRYGPVRVLLADALKAVKGSRRKTL